MARRAGLSAAVIVVALGIASAVVWATPGGEAAPPPLADQLAASAAENEELRAELEDAQARLDRRERDASPTPTPTATPKPTPPPSPAPPAEETEPDGPDTIVIYRDADTGNESQPAPPPPPPAPAKPAAPAEPNVTAPPMAELISPEQRHFGMYTAQAPFNFATFDDAAVKAGSRQSLVGYFGGWDQPFRADAVQNAWGRGLMPMLTWESRPIAAQNDQPEDPQYSLPRIIGDPEASVPGAFDEYLRQYARDIVATGLPLAIRLDHEMNGLWYPWSEQKSDGTSLNGNRPGDFAKMWRHVHDIFEGEGANQFVIWTWAPNIINNLPERHQSIEYLRSLYPGDEYVDWVGVSGYLRSPFKEENDFTFDYTFGRTLEQLREITDKPIILAEIGATEVGGHKPAWIEDVFDAFARPENADVIGFAWFNLAVTTVSQGELITNDWRIESRPESLAAFTEGLADPAAGFKLTTVE
jgi:hypothetical protein